MAGRELAYLQAMTRVTLKDAAADLPGLIERARAGEAIVIFDGQKALVRLDPIIRAEGPRKPGSWHGRLVEPVGLLDPLSDGELEDWLGKSA